jgi:glutathionyl-hydroquinone reductase
MEITGDFEVKKIFSKEEESTEVEKIFEQDCAVFVKSVCDYIPKNLHSKIKELLQIQIENAMLIAYFKGYLRATQNYADKSEQEVKRLKELFKF